MWRRPSQQFAIATGISAEQSGEQAAETAGHAAAGLASEAGLSDQHASLTAGPAAAQAARAWAVLERMRHFGCSSIAHEAALNDGPPDEEVTVVAGLAAGAAPRALVPRMILADRLRQRSLWVELLRIWRSRQVKQ